MDATLVLFKPDGITKSLTGNILTELSEARLEIAACKCVRVSKELAEEHYKSLKNESFYNELIKYIMGEYHKKKVLAFVYWGDDALRKVRELAGATNPEEAEADSIRGKYGRITTRGIFENVIHASSDAKEAEREIKLWFEPDEIIFDIYPTKEDEATVKKRAWA
ncbi:MAG: nucleoside-diphosphate kinase [Candidatus Omnitrophica bacterium]|nr:nucleoside-diphosphate kinase [Candidatus Omnitrophota bacterium]